MARIRLPSAFPGAADFQGFKDEPLDSLAEARRIHGDLFLLREAGPLFSRVRDCPGVVAAFGVENQRAVLSDMESFGMPISAAQDLGLPQNLVNLNHSLHSMRGDKHALQKRLLAALLADRQIESYHRLVCSALTGFGEDFRVGSTVGLMSSMRDLALLMSSHVLFGAQYAEDAGLTRLLQTYFHQRRELSSPASSAATHSRDELIEIGNALDNTLRAYTRDCRESRGAPTRGLLGRLATLAGKAEWEFSEDEVVGHSNVLFISSTEPIATTLTWVLLVLSQKPALRDELRKEISAASGSDDFPAARRLGRLQLLSGVINESLRLLPPNAFMVRIARKPTSLNRIPLPEEVEVVLCPFLAHRDADAFERPTEFLPDRWNDARPSPFQYFPFGAGGHSCVGRSLATYLIKMSLVFLLPRFDLVLAGDQEIDWRLHIMFMPRTDPAVIIRSLSEHDTRQCGKLTGPVSKLLPLGDARRS